MQDFKNVAPLSDFDWNAFENGTAETQQTQEELEKFFSDKAHIGMNSGSMFGPGGNGYMRMNVGCPRSVLGQAIDQIVAALG